MCVCVGLLPVWPFTYFLSFFAAFIITWDTRGRNDEGAREGCRTCGLEWGGGIILAWLFTSTEFYWLSLFCFIQHMATYLKIYVFSTKNNCITYTEDWSKPE